MFEIIFFSTDSGKQPVKEFLDELDVKMRNKILDNLKHLQIHGTFLREPYSKPLGDGIFELRTRWGNDITRVLYFFFAEKRIVLTHGFIKKTQKTPVREIERAKKYRVIYCERERRNDMDDLDRYIAEQMKDPAFREEHERTRLEFALTELLITARMEQALTQKELAEKSGVRQSNISRIEKGQAVPSLVTLDKIAKALGKAVQVSFV